MRTLHLSCSVVLALAWALPPLPAQPRFVHRPERPCKLTARHILDEVVIKFREGSAVRLRSGRLISLNRSANPNLVMRLVGVRKLRRFFLRTEEDLDRERAEILRRLPEGERPPGELNLYFVVKTQGQKDSEALIDALNEDPAVEVAFADWNPEKAYTLFGNMPAGNMPAGNMPAANMPAANMPAANMPAANRPGGDIPPTTPDWSAKQTDLGPAPNGTNALTAWRLAGGRGQGLTVGHVEYGWLAEHEDIPNLKGARRLGSALQSVIYTFHGAACVGLLNAEHNAYGIRGYAPEAGLVLSGVVSGTANGVSLIAKTLGKGDVMSSSYGVFMRCNGRQAALPPEAGNQADFDAIKNATAKGIIYTVSAGNSGRDLDDACWNGMFDLKKRDSGALVIGGSLTSSRSRHQVSNFGSRVDAHGWAAGVHTAGYGYLFKPNFDQRQYYTDRFGGTSAAAAHVGGVCASFMSAVREQNGAIPTAKQMRDILRKHGSPAPASQKIGGLPDLKKMLAAFGLPDGLEITKDAERAGSLELKISGKARGGFFLAASPARGRVPIGLNRPLLLDPKTMLVMEMGTFGSATSVTRKYPVPNSLVFVGLSIYLQVMDWDRQQNVHMTSSVEVFVRK